MRLYYADTFELPLPDGHRFPLSKYRLLRESLAAGGAFSAADFCLPEAASDALLATAHDPDYVRRMGAGEVSAAEMRRIGFPWSAGMVERARRSAGATLAACRAALTDGVGVTLAGGTHHAHARFGAGFCVFNDAAIAARTLLQDGVARRVAIIDCDVHQGDGTAAILADEPHAFTLSVHAQKNFPFRKQVSDLDIELPDDCPDAAYLAALAPALDAVFDGFRPDFVLYLAGADPFVGDRLGRLALSIEGLAARDQAVFARVRRAGVPAAVAMAGGYAEPIDDTVAIHRQTVLLAARCLAGR